MTMDTPHLSRRSFLVGGLAVTALTSLTPSILARRARRDDPVLVVVQLTGGNDGLNTVVPFRQDAYYRLRPSISVAPGSVHKLDDETALHAELGDLAELYQQGDLAVVQGVGYPEPDRSHFRSMQVWHTADPRTSYGAGAERPESGWLGRIATELAADGVDMPALHLGTGDLPLALKTRAGFTPTVRDASGFQLATPLPGFEAARARMLAASASNEAPTLATLRAAAASTYDAAARMEDLVRTGGPSAYPNHPLAERLALCAQLVAGGFGTRVFGLEHGGFDTHARQGPSHAALLRELGASLAAFQRDLRAKGAADRVVTLVFSEFGRRVDENASKGTDHGAAGPGFLMGSRVRGGLLGTRPNLEPLAGGGDLAYGVDFRSIYAALESEWLGVKARTTAPAMDALFG
jgi:uncharacterized protein (DUF1501 family)